MSRYAETYQRWQQDPEGFWADAAGLIDWAKPWDDVYAQVDGLDRWFVGAECNTAWNCLDRHVAAGRGDQAALIVESPVTDSKATYTYAQLLDEVSLFAGVLRDHGVAKGDRVIIYMPMIIEAVVAMLACARIGAVHSVVFGGFASNELATRIDDAKPRVVVSASCGIESSRVVAYKPLLDEALRLATHIVAVCIIKQRPEAVAETGDADRDWDALMADARTRGLHTDCVNVAATDPLYVLYTSGTTGEPKGVVRDNGGHMVALAWSMRAIYGVDPGEVFWAASDVGWVVGHSYIVYAPLLHGATGIVFEGKPVGTPDASAYWRIVAKHGVAALFTAPTAFRAIRKEDPDGAMIKKYDISSLRTLFLAGERADPPTVQWAEQQLGIPVIDHWWQTETGSPVAANPVGLGLLPVKYGSSTVPMPGYDVRVLDQAGSELPRGELGAICLKLPLPPGCLPTLWHNDERFRSSYLSRFPGFYETADAGMIDEDGYLFIMSRTDDVINVAGHRLSTGAIEEVLASHSDVSECAVLGAADAVKGQVPVGFLVLKSDVEKDSAVIEAEAIGLVRDRIGAVVSFKCAIVVARLPKTRSGKILRATLRRIVDGEDVATPATIDDPAILDEIRAVLHARPSR